MCNFRSFQIISDQNMKFRSLKLSEILLGIILFFVIDSIFLMVWEIHGFKLYGFAIHGFAV